MITITGTAQDAVEVFWTIATHEDVRICSRYSPIYQAAEKAMLAAIRAEFDVSPAVARRVRQLVSEYGTDDSLSGTGNLRGVASYVHYALRNRKV